MKRILLLTLIAAAALCAQEEPPAPQAPAGGGGGGGGRGFGGGAGQNAEPQPYDRVISKDAKTTKGLFTIHQIRERYFYEIPKSALGKEFLWNTQIAKTTFGAGYGGGQLENKVVRWDLKGNRVLLSEITYGVSADPNSPIAAAVKAANNDSIIMSFPVAAFNKEGDPVIEVGRLFTSDIQEFSARQRIDATGVDATRTFIERITPFQDNIETEVTMTYTSAGRGGAGRGGLGGGSMRGNSATVVLHHSMVKLPEKPMMPRLFDERVGYFTVSTMDYSHSDHKAERVRHAAVALPAGAGGGRGGRGPANSGDEKPLYRAELRSLNASISAAIAKTTDHETKAHLEASKDEIARILDPKFATPSAPVPALGGGRGGLR